MDETNAMTETSVGQETQAAQETPATQAMPVASHDPASVGGQNYDPFAREYNVPWDEIERDAETKGAGDAETLGRGDAETRGQGVEKLLIDIGHLTFVINFPFLIFHFSFHTVVSILFFVALADVSFGRDANPLLVLGVMRIHQTTNPPNHETTKPHKIP